MTGSRYDHHGHHCGIDQLPGGKFFDPTIGDAPLKQIEEGVKMDYSKAGPELFRAILLVTEKVRYIQKKDRNDQQRYTYLSDQNVTEKVNEALCEAGLVPLPPVVLEHGVVFDVMTKAGRKMIVTHVRVQYGLAHAESGQYITGIMDGYGSDIGDKGLNCALTSARKYFWIQAFNIASGDDPEQYHLIGDPTAGAAPPSSPLPPAGTPPIDIKALQDQLFNMLSTFMPPDAAGQYVGKIPKNIDALNMEIDKANEEIKKRKVNNVKQ